MKDQGIKEIFKSAFNNFEADVDPSVWTNVQQAINTPTPSPASHASNGSIAGKAGVVAGKIGAKTILAIVTTVTGVSIGTYFLLSDSHTEKAVTPKEQTQQPVAKTIPQQEALANDNAVIKGADMAVAPEAKKIAPQQKVKEGQKEIFRSPVITEQHGSTSENVAPPNKNTSNTNPVAPKQPKSSNPQPAGNATTPAAPKENETTTPGEPNAASSENQGYQNGFVDINNYLEPEEATGTTALPNILTPNGDGKNDELKLKTKNLKSLMVTIFDQSGKTIHQWDGLDGSWDGNLSDGSPAPEGNYYYSLMAETIDGKRCIGGSHLTLRRR